MKIYDVIIDSEDAIKIVSFVEEPAIEKDWILLSKEEEVSTYVDSSNPQWNETTLNPNINALKRIVTAPIIIPNKLIYRKGDFYIRFTEDTVNKMKDIFLKSVNKFVNFNHNGEISNSAELIEFYQINENLQNSLFPDLPVGSLMASYKINDDELLSKVISGDYNGFSIEVVGKLIQSLQLSNDNNMDKMSIKEMLKEFLIEWGIMKPEVEQVEEKVTEETVEAVEQKLEQKTAEEMEEINLAKQENETLKSENLQLKAKIEEINSKLVTLQKELDADAADKLKKSQKQEPLKAYQIALNTVKNLKN
jgi:DNA-binding transcriptional MerR regulator